MVVFLWSSIAMGEIIEATNRALQEVEEHIKWFHRKVSDRRTNRALKHSAMVVSIAIEENEDPLLIASIISNESCWLPTAISKTGCVGLMQVSTSEGFDLSKPYGQIKAGISKLKKWRASCGPDLENILNGYVSGNCSRKSKYVKYIIWMHKESKRKFRK